MIEALEKLPPECSVVFRVEGDCLTACLMTDPPEYGWPEAGSAWAFEERCEFGVNVLFGDEGILERLLSDAIQEFLRKRDQNATQAATGPPTFVDA